MASIIVYFSRRGENYVSGTLKELTIGNTEVAAGVIRELTRADTFSIEPVQPYSKRYNDCIAQAQADQRRDARPELKRYPESLDGYDTVYLGYPIWWGIAAWPVNSFVKGNDFTGKTVIPFCTSASSPLAGSGEKLAAMTTTGDWKSGQRFSSGASQSTVKTWVDGLEF